MHSVCVEMRYPYAHRPLVEFLCSRPPSEIYGAEQARWLQRAALVDVLPEAVRTRTGKAGPDQAIARAVDREWDRLREMVRNSRAGARGYVDEDRVLAELARWQHGLVTGFGDLLKVIALEMWLTSLESRSRARAPLRTGHAAEVIATSNERPLASLSTAGGS